MICTDCPTELCNRCGKCHMDTCEAEQLCKKEYIKGYGVLKVVQYEK